MFFLSDDVVFVECFREKCQLNCENSRSIQRVVWYVFQASLQQKCPHTLMIVRSGKNIIDLENGSLVDDV